MNPDCFARLRAFEAVVVGVLALVLAVVFVASISKAFGALPIPYKWFSPPTKTKVCVQVMWVTQDRAAELCKGGGACWFPSATGGHDLIVAVKPSDFNDTWLLMVLGHELYHAMGSQHD